jgi:Protein of unknown function (DUF3311)
VAYATGAFIRAPWRAGQGGDGPPARINPWEDAMARKNPAAYAAATILVLVGIAGTLWVPIYARTTPKWGAFPFFYWYQLIWIPGIAILSWLAYLLLRTRPAPGADAGPQAASDGKERT